MPARLAVTLLVVLTTVATTSCASLLGAEPTPVPGAAATLTRSSRTPIPTPTRDSSPSPAASPAVARSPVASPSARPGGRPLTEEEIDAIQRQMRLVLADGKLLHLVVGDVRQVRHQHIDLDTVFDQRIEQVALEKGDVDVVCGRVALGD